MILGYIISGLAVLGSFLTAGKTNAIRLSGFIIFGLTNSYWIWFCVNAHIYVQLAMWIPFLLSSVMGVKSNWRK